MSIRIDFDAEETPAAEDKDYALLEKTVEGLKGKFDSIRIFATKVYDNDRPISFSYGVGNGFATTGQLREYLLRHDSSIVRDQQNRDCEE